MRPFCRRLYAPTCGCLFAAPWRVPSRSLSDVAAARRQQQQRKAERTSKLLEYFRQRARGTTTTNSATSTATPPLSSSSFSQPPQPPFSSSLSQSSEVAGSAADGSSSASRLRPAFFKPSNGERRTRREQQPRTVPPTKSQARSQEQRVQEDDDEDDEDETEDDLGRTNDGNSAARHSRKQAEQLRALIDRRRPAAHNSPRDYLDALESAVPSFAELYEAATATVDSSSSSTSASHVRPKPQQRVLSLSILGLPNSGKSSLTNRLCHSHITAVSPKTHTTRSNVTGVHTDVAKQVQLVIHDTPGILGRHEGKRHERDMSIAAWLAAADVNVVLVCVDAAKRWTETTSHMLAELTALCRTHYTLTPILVLNKVDLVHPKRELLSLAQQCVEACRYIKDVYYISVTEDDGVTDLIDALQDKAKPAEFEYEPHVVSDMSPLERIEEVIREQLYRRYNQELPYSIEQRHVGWSEGEGWVRVEQQLRVDSEAQRSIVIGGRGSGVEWVKREAEREASEMLGKRVSLHLSVQVGKKKDGVTGYS